VVVLVLAEPLAEEESAGHCRHCRKDAAVLFVQDVVHFEGLDRGRKLAKEGDNVWKMQLVGK
jgi:hypothetical protein